VFIIPRKAKVAEETDNFDDSHTYKCLRCGVEHQNPIGHFYKIQYSELYLKNDRYVPLCKNCINEMYENSLVSNAEFSNTLKNINNNLNSLNAEMKGANERIDDIEDKIIKIDNKSKIDLWELVKQYAVPVIMGGGIVYFILKVTGMI
jgi:hypothetical protein